MAMTASKRPRAPVPSSKRALAIPRRAASARACAMAAGERSTPTTSATCGASSSSVSPIPQPRLNTPRPAAGAGEPQDALHHVLAQRPHGGPGEMPLRETAI